MKMGKFSLPLALVMVMAATGAQAQPQTKLTTGLDKATIQAIWCSSLLLEESFAYPDESEELFYYEQLAFDLGDAIDEILIAHGLREEEIDEIWEIFDDEAFDLAIEDDEAFLAQVEVCEVEYDGLLG